MTLKERKRISRFDLGKNQIGDNQRQSTTPVDTSKLSATGLYTGYADLADNYNSQVTPTITNGALSTLGTAGSVFMSSLATQAAQQAVQTGVSTGTSAAASAIGGGIVAAAGTAQGAFLIADAYDRFKNTTSVNEMINASGRSTNSKFGHTYLTYDGFDENGVILMTEALNRADKTNGIMAGIQTGASAGAGIGSIWGPIGTAAGTVLGGATGALIGLFEGNSEAKKRMNRVKANIASANAMMERHNMLTESEAGSAGLRDMYNARANNTTGGILRANNGKLSTYNTSNKTGSLKYVWTPEGPLLGYEQAVVGKNEVVVDPIDKKAYKIDSGTEGVDNQSYGMPLGKEDHFGPSIVFSKTKKVIDPDTGQITTPSDIVTPWIDYYNDNGEEDYMYLKKHTKQVNHQNAIRAFNKAALALENATSYDKGKYDKGKNIRRFKDGWLSKAGTWMLNNGGAIIDGIGPVFAHFDRRGNIGNMRNIIGEKGPLPQVSAQNNNARAALDIMGGLGYDPSAQLAEMNRVAALNRYNINQTGSLTSGQKAALTTAANNQLFSLRRQIIADAYNKNAAYKQAYANALMSSGEAQAGRDWNSSKYNADAIINQNASYVSNLLKHESNILKSKEQMWQDFSTNKYQNRMLDLWDKKMRQNANDLDRTKNNIIEDVANNAARTGTIDLTHAYEYNPNLAMYPRDWRSYVNYLKLSKPVLPISEQDWMYGNIDRWKIGM